MWVPPVPRSLRAFVLPMPWGDGEAPQSPQTIHSPAQTRGLTPQQGGDQARGPLPAQEPLHEQPETLKPPHFTPRKKSSVCSQTHPGGRKTLRATHRHKKGAEQQESDAPSGPVPNPPQKHRAESRRGALTRQRWSARHTLRSSRQLGLCLSS